MLAVRILNKAAALAVLIPVLMIIALIMMASIWERTREESAGRTSQYTSTPRTTTPLNTSTLVIPLGVSKVSLLCENTDLAAGVVSGDCTIVVVAVNKGVKPLHIYYLTFPDTGLRIPVEKVLDPGREESIVREFYIPNPTPLRQVLKGIIATDLGNIEVNVEISI